MHEQAFPSGEGGPRRVPDNEQSELSGFGRLRWMRRARTAYRRYENELSVPTVN